MHVSKILSILLVTLSFLLGVASGSAGVVAAPTVSPPTRANLLHAMNTEAFAYAQYHAYADGAKQSSQPNLAHIWSTTGDEQFHDHFTTEADLVGIVGSNAENVIASITAENEAISTYQRFAKQAQAQGCSTVATRFTEMADDEATHHRLFTSALHALPGQSQIPAPPLLHSTAIHRSTAVCSGQTETNLTTAEHSEALAWGEYTLFAQKAAKTRLAQLFNGIAAVELQDHFANSAILSGLVGRNAANVQASRTAEADAVQMYTTFASAATSAGESLVAKTFRQFRGDEAKHEAAFKRALANVTS